MKWVYNKCLIKGGKKGKYGLTQGKAECGCLSMLLPEPLFLCHPAGCYTPCKNKQKTELFI